MTALTETMESPTSWFVGASFGGTDDQTSRFLSEGIWELKNPTDQDAALVKSMRAGDRIAIKAAYTRKHDLPFDNRGRFDEPTLYATTLFDHIDTHFERVATVGRFDLLMRETR